MKPSRFSDAQKAFILKQGTEGMPVAEICRKAGISQATYFNWKRKYDRLLPTEMRRLKQLEDENAKLRKVVADLSLDKEMLQDVQAGAITLGSDKGFDAADFVMELREINVTPHIARNTSRRSAIDGRTTRHPGYASSQRIRKRIEEDFGWMKTVAGFRKTKYRGIEKVGWAFTLAAAAYNLIRLPKLMAEPG